jgi:hypothetical protein
MMFKMDVKPNFSVADEAAVSTPPKVDFGKQPGAPATPPPPPKTSAITTEPKTASATSNPAADLPKKGY